MKPRASLFATVNHEFLLGRTQNPIDEAYDSYQRCQNPHKINLTIGVYRDELGRPYSFSVVKKAEQELLRDSLRTKEYLNYDGCTHFRTAVTDYLLGGGGGGDLASRLASGRFKTIQTLSGTGALRLALEAMRSLAGCSVVYIPDHYYLLYDNILLETGYREVRRYRYYDKSANCLIFHELLAAMMEAPPKSLFLFNTCAHNPTGTDLDPQQWRRVAALSRERQLIPIMDTAYLGLVSGDPFADAYPLRLFLEMDVEMLTTLSFSKCLGLYSERVGCLFIWSGSATATSELSLRIDDIVTGSYMCPPKNGADIVTHILTSPSLLHEWNLELSSVLGTPGDWTRIKTQHGLFVYLDLTEEDVMYMMEHHSVFVVRNGRLNVSGLNDDNLDRVAHCLHDAVTRPRRGQPPLGREEPLPRPG